MSLQNDMLIRQIVAITAGVLRLKTQRPESPQELLDDVGDLLDRALGLRKEVALRLDPEGLIALLSPGGVFDATRAGTVCTLLELRADGLEELGKPAEALRHRLQVQGLRAHGAVEDEHEVAEA